jgi:hypothetical protein
MLFSFDVEMLDTPAGNHFQELIDTARHGGVVENLGTRTLEELNPTWMSEEQALVMSLGTAHIAGDRLLITDYPDLDLKIEGGPDIWPSSEVPLQAILALESNDTLKLLVTRIDAHIA